MRCQPGGKRIDRYRLTAVVLAALVPLAGVSPAWADGSLRCFPWQPSPATKQEKAKDATGEPDKNAQDQDQENKSEPGDQAKSDGDTSKSEPGLKLSLQEQSEGWANARGGV